MDAVAEPEAGTQTLELGPQGVGRETPLPATEKKGSAEEIRDVTTARASENTVAPSPDLHRQVRMGAQGASPGDVRADGRVCQRRQRYYPLLVRGPGPTVLPVYLEHVTGTAAVRRDISDVQRGDLTAA